MKDKNPSIAEKVRFWEEQDKINNAIIPRFLEDHKQIVELSKEVVKLSAEVSEVLLQQKQMLNSVNVRFSEMQNRISELSREVDTFHSIKEVGLPKKYLIIHGILTILAIASAIAITSLLFP